MVKRLRKSLWTTLMQRSVTAMTRSMLAAGQRSTTRAVTKAVKRAVTQTAAQTVRPTRVPKAAVRKKSPGTRGAAGKTAGAEGRRQASLAAGGGSWSGFSVVGPAGRRQGHLYTPPRSARSTTAPLVVMLHGCGQSAESFALSTRMNRLAARAGWFVLYPAQDRLAHPKGCWNWYATRTGAAQAEVATLLAAVDLACATHPIDPGRVAVAGLSAGAGMAALLALAHPGRFRAAVMHSGVPPGAAHSTGSALRAMLGTGRGGALGVLPGAGLPPLLVIHGSADTVVAPANGRAAARLWAEAGGALPGPTRRLQRGQRRSATVTDYRRRGRLAVTLCEIDQVAHAWSGGAASEDHGDPRGPDASRLAAAFIARQFALAAPRPPTRAADGPG